MVILIADRFDPSLARRLEELGIAVRNTPRASAAAARARAFGMTVQGVRRSGRTHDLAGNVIMTPHIGANTKENLLRIGEEVYNAVTNFQTEHV